MVRKQIRHIPEPEIFTLDCPTQQFLDIIGNKWTVIVIYCLAYSPKRYRQIERKIEGISQKMLTQTLKNLERHGLVERTVYPEIPPKVEYALTSLGETLIESLVALADWSDSYFPQVKAARDRYDRSINDKEII